MASVGWGRGWERPIGLTECRGLEDIAAAAVKESVVELHRQTVESVVRLHVEPHHLHTRAPRRLWVREGTSLMKRKGWVRERW